MEVVESMEFILVVRVDKMCFSGSSFCKAPLMNRQGRLTMACV